MPQNHSRFFELDVGGNELRVHQFNAFEKISEPFAVDLDLASENDLKLDDMVGQFGCLSILNPWSDAERYFHGIISEFRQAESKGRFFLYRARMVPALWLLTLRHTCRIFQNKSTPDIVKEVLRGARLPADTYDFRLTGTYAPREYCVQYRETDFAFMSRLIEAEGIYYFFEHSKDKHVLVFGDAAVNYMPIAAPDEVEFHAPDSMVPQEDSVFAFDLGRQLHSQRVMLKDYNFIKPSLNLTCKQESKADSTYAIYDYPGDYDDGGIGNTLASVRLQEATAMQNRGLGKSTCARFAPGFTFKLKEHDRTDIDGEYLLVALQHSGKQPQVLEEVAATDEPASYTNDIVAIPSSVIFRPSRRTPQAQVMGVQSAIVVGPKDEEIYTDTYGRVKVRFHWDIAEIPDDQRTCWIRVAQTMAGAGWGAMQIPRVGHEVLVDFMEGDPDRPVIIGQLYHGLNLPPYKLPDERTKSTLKTNTTPNGGGFNEIRFEDKKGEEQIFIRSQGNLDIRALGARHEEIGGERHLLVKKDKFDTIEENCNLIVKKDFHTSVGGDYGIEIEGQDSKEVKGKRSLKVGGDVAEEFGGDHSEKARGSIVLKAGDNLVIEAASNITLKVGGSFIAIESGGITIKTSAALELEGSTTAELKGGASTKIESSGTTEIKGSLVKIN